MAALDNITDTIADNPGIVAAAVALGAFFLLSNRGGNSNIQDIANTVIASQSQSNAITAQLAQAQVQREAIRAGRDAVAIDAIKDVSLGAQELAKTDKQSAIALGSQLIQAGNVSSQVNSDFLNSAVSNVTNFKAQLADIASRNRQIDSNLLTQFKALNTTGDIETIKNRTALQLADIDSRKAIALTNIDSEKAIALTNISSNLEHVLANIGRDLSLRSQLIDVSTIPATAKAQERIIDAQGRNQVDVINAQGDIVKNIGKRSTINKAVGGGLGILGSVAKGVGKIFGF